MMGHIAVFYSMPTVKANGTAFVEDADWQTTSGKNYTWLGADGECMANNTIVVGVPGWRTTDDTQ